MTHLENPLRVRLRRVPHSHDPFVAGTLALFEQALADPPYEWMEPEDCFDELVDGTSQVVAAANMANFVRQDRLQLFRREPVRDSLGQQQDRPKDSGDSRLTKPR